VPPPLTLKAGALDWELRVVRSTIMHGFLQRGSGCCHLQLRNSWNETERQSYAKTAQVSFITMVFYIRNVSSAATINQHQVLKADEYLQGHWKTLLQTCRLHSTAGFSTMRNVRVLKADEHLNSSRFNNHANDVQRKDFLQQVSGAVVNSACWKQTYLQSRCQTSS